ncbi:MAG: hypothetical protein ACXWDI_15065 [Nocardioides sp.]
MATAAVASLAAAGALQWLGRTYGSTAEERRRQLPGDELVEAPQVITNHATTIEGTPASVWPWLAQMGWGRGQWYTARWVDKLLFPRNGPSADVVVPELQNLKVGDKVLDGPPEANCSFTVEGLEENRHLVMHSREHLPPGWAERGAGIDFTWVFVLDDLGDGRTRFLFRCRLRVWPRWVETFYVAAMVPADFVMSRQMMRGLSCRVERTSRQSLRPWAA